MATANYEQVRDALYHRQAFEHGSCEAWRRDGAERHDYTVRSYDTIIFRYDVAANHVLYFDNRYYSNTTSRLQNMIRDQFGMGGTDYDARIIY